MSCDPYLQNQTSQFSTSSLTSLRRETAVYFNQKCSGRTQFTSNADYLSYKKAQAMAASQPTLVPQPQEVYYLQKNGCGPCPK